MISTLLNMQLNLKFNYVKWFIVFAALLIIVRLSYLQLYLHRYFITKGEKNYSRIEYIPSLRGNIIDRNGILLATNRPVTNIYWQGTGNRTLLESQKNTIQIIQTILKKNNEVDDFSFTCIASSERMYKELLLAQDISFEQLSQLAEKLPNHPNILFKTDFQRYYPHTTIASHLIGYLNMHTTTGSYGQMGLEKLLEESLKGKNGSLARTINSVGRNITSSLMEEAAAGKNIHTTLDIVLQKICEEVFPEEQAGTMIVMNPQDGSLLAVVSRPTFDPAMFLQPISAQDWQTMQNKKPFINRAFNASYPPGSIFKLITITALLERAHISPDATIYCKGYVTFAGRRYWCNQRYGHGRLTIPEAIAQSCNTLFFEAGKHFDIDLIAHYAYLFGLGKKTDLPFQEKAGIVPSRAWKRLVKKEPWWPGETLSATIGQSFLLATPIQIACMISSIFTGFLIKPRILIQEAVVKKPLAILPESRRFLKKVMKKTVTMGTAKKLSKLENMHIYAKTSTAQTSSLEKRSLGTHFFEHGWFACYMRYNNHTPLTIIILVENAGTSQIPILVAKKFLRKYQEYCDDSLN